ncbi:hypothetical protein AB0H76_13000 [Nocardia sp. NPDC050712]|uniref:hypothetical protein n=1 Tax=Nocardia sp. NPDC050712 TaxID=3155518 RepID=UPI0033C0832B
MPGDLAVPRPARSSRRRAATGGDIAAFIAELVHSGLRPAEHSRSLAPGRSQSIALVGWSLEGCRGYRRGCGPECVTVVTTSGRIAAMADQPARARFRHARPAYLESADRQSLRLLLAAGRSILLPRPLSA